MTDTENYRKRLKQIGFPENSLDETLELLRLDNAETIRTELGNRHWDVDFFQWFLPRFQKLYKQDDLVRDRTIKGLYEVIRVEKTLIEEYVIDSGNIPTATFALRYQLKNKKPFEKDKLDLLDITLRRIVLKELKYYVGV